jgi:uncharacterized membrane protein YraQ (UPF0718 family)
LVAFLAAAIVEEFISTKRLMRYFGKNDVPSLLRATFAGLAASTCSCGAIVLAASFRKRGISTAAGLTFVLAAPFLGLPMLIVFFSFIGIPNTLLIMAVGLIVAFCSGLILARLENKGLIEQKVMEHHKEGEHVHCIACDEERRSNESMKKRLLVNVPMHFKHTLFDIGKWILIGLFIAAFIASFIPAMTIAEHLGEESGVASIFIALPFAAIIETCSEGFAIVGGQLYTMGASLAVIFVLLMVGVATDVTELLVIWRKFGKKSALAYLFVGTVLTLIAATALLLFV